MTKEYTVALFGHRHMENPREIENQLETIITDLVCRHDMLRFLIGRDGDFDLMAASVLKRVSQRFDRADLLVCCV